MLGSKEANTNRAFGHRDVEASLDMQHEAWASAPTTAFMDPR